MTPDRTDAGIDDAPAAAERCVIAFGSNLGDRGETVLAAVRELADIEGVELIRVSPVYESVAVTLSGADPDAPRYLNGVVVVRTTLAPRALLARLHEIEDRHGRQRTERWASRTLDLDIVEFGGRRSSDPELLLPHPRAAERSFVLVPWLDVDPDAELVGVGRVRDLPAAAEPLVRAGR